MRAMSESAGFSFKCTRCGEKEAVVKRGRKIFLCASCASDAMWHDMVGAFTEAPDPSEGSASTRET